MVRRLARWLGAVVIAAGVLGVPLPGTGALSEREASAEVVKFRSAKKKKTTAKSRKSSKKTARSKSKRKRKTSSKSKKTVVVKRPMP